MIAERFIREGKQKGKLKAKREIARNMLRKGTEIDFIVEVTGLSQEEVQRLAEEAQAEARIKSKSV